jgi:cell division topological specificity factor
MDMFENILNFFKKLGKNENKETSGSKTKAKERLHLVLMQDRANVSADFLEMMKQEIIDVIKKYIEVEENEIDVRLTNEVKEDGTTGAPSLYANIPIVNIRNDMKKEVQEEKKEEAKKQEKSEEPKEVKEEIKVEEKEENVEETSKQDEQEEVVEVVEVKEETKKD